jgi:hypothetical protein
MLGLIIHYSFSKKIFFLEQNEVLIRLKVYIILTQLRSFAIINHKVLSGFHLATAICCL